MTDGGSGTVLMIHGAFCTGEVWRGFRAWFEGRGWRVVAPTLRADCRVRSDPPPALERLGLEDYAADLAQKIAGIVRDTGRAPALIGHSMGGLLARRVGARYESAGGVYREYPDRGHWLPGEPGWEDVAAACVRFFTAARASAEGPRTGGSRGGAGSSS